MKKTNNLGYLIAPLIGLFLIACAQPPVEKVVEDADQPLAEARPLSQIVPTVEEQVQDYPEPAVAPASEYPEPEPMAEATEPYPEPDQSAPSAEFQRLVPEVLAEYPHNRTVFTQGLVWLGNGSFYESGGLYGQSALYEVGLAEGNTIRQIAIGPEFFAEGIALIDDRIVMLTWREQTALVFDAETFAEIGRFSYEGEGWGLCYDSVGNQLWMSNGSNKLMSRHPDTFEILSELDVTLQGQPVFQINELECVGSQIYANIWKSDRIMVIDSTSGRVAAEIDASNLLSPEERNQLQPGRQVLNGIAYNREKDLFYLTGKEWSKLFEVRFVSP